MNRKEVTDLSQTVPGPSGPGPHFSTLLPSLNLPGLPHSEQGRSAIETALLRGWCGRSPGRTAADRAGVEVVLEAKERVCGRTRECDVNPA